MKNALLIAASVAAMALAITATSASAEPTQILELNCWPDRIAGHQTKFDIKCQADQQVRIENVEKPKPNPCDPKRFSKAWKPISKALKNYASLKPKQKEKLFHRIAVLVKMKKECKNCYPTTTVASVSAAPEASSAKDHKGRSRQGGDGNRAALDDLSIMPAAYILQ